MANLLESMLAGGKVKRQDDKHLTITRRPLPTTQRQLLELFAALGMTATFPGLLRTIEVKEVDPQQIVFIALARWPTLAEVAEFPEPYQTGPHLVSLIRSPAFRTHFVRNACDAFAERKRLLFVRIPRSGGASVLNMLHGRHPLLPVDLAAPRFDDGVMLIQTMGEVLSHMSTSKFLAISHTRMAPFLNRQPGRKRAGADQALDDPFTWRGVMPPCRVEDTLFTVLREPEARGLGQINALLSAWQSGARPIPASVAARMEGPAKRARLGDWRQLGRDILAETLLTNPICTALGDGTAEGVRTACSRSPLQLVQLEQLNTWSRTELENMAGDTEAAGEPILRRQDFGPSESEAFEAAIAQDRIVYDRFLKRIRDTSLPAVRARDI